MPNERKATETRLILITKLANRSFLGFVDIRYLSATNTIYM